jgi:hypothetical protein
MESDGTTVLDNTIFYLCSDIGDGANHNHWDMPVLVVGGTNGLPDASQLAINGRHINYYSATDLPLPRTSTNYVGPRNPNQNTAQVQLQFLAAHGLPATTFGLYTGTGLTEMAG